jgi:hypothetical protein
VIYSFYLYHFVLHLLSSSLNKAPTAYHYIGRWREIKEHNRQNHTMMEAAWPGTEVQARFIGDRLSVCAYSPLRASSNATSTLPPPIWVELYIDGRMVKSWPLTHTHQCYAIESLKWGRHKASLRKRTESSTGVLRFDKFIVHKGRLLKYIPLKQLKIEFIGASHECGYGILERVKAPQACIGKTENESVSRAYPFQVGELLNAEVWVHAYSGKGIWRNLSGETKQSLPKMYTWIDPDGDQYDMQNKWWYSTFSAPSIRVINLGGNDFAQGIPPKNIFVSHYVEFIKQLKLSAPQAQIIMLLNSRFVGKERWVAMAYLQSVIMALPEERILFLPLDQYNGPYYGCDWHSDWQQHQHIARQIFDFIREHELETH